MKKTILTLCSVALAGMFLLLAVNRFQSFDRTVSVRGLCEREVDADLAIYPLSFNVMGDDPVALNNEITRNNKIVVDFLKANGFDDAEINIAPPKVTDRDAEGYYPAGNHYRYSIRSTVSLYSSKIDKVRELTTKQGELLQQGVAIGGGDYTTPTVFEFTALNAVKPDMIQEANNNARAAAEQFANDSGSRLGKIKEATQGLFTIEDRDSYTPNVKRVRVVTYVTYYLR